MIVQVGSQFTITASHTFAGDSIDQYGGVYQVTVTITGDENMTTTVPVEVTRPPGLMIVANEPAQLGTTLTSPVLAVFVEPDDTDGTGEFSASINWGDGTTGSGTVQEIGTNTGLFEVVGPTHTYSTSPTGSLLVSVSQDWGSSNVAIQDGGFVQQKKAPSGNKQGGVQPFSWWDVTPVGLINRLGEAMAQNDRAAKLVGEQLEIEIQRALQTVPWTPAANAKPDTANAKKNAANFFERLDYESFGKDVVPRAKKAGKSSPEYTRWIDLQIVARTIALKLRLDRDRANGMAESPQDKTSYRNELRDPDVISAVKRLSTLQKEMIKEFFPGPQVGGINVAAFQQATEWFNNFELVPYEFQKAINNIRNLAAGKSAPISVLRGPDRSIAHARWYEFAQIAIEVDIDKAFWQQLSPMLLEGTAITETILSGTPSRQLTPAQISEIRDKYTVIENQVDNFLGLLRVMLRDSANTSGLNLPGKGKFNEP